MTRAVVGSLCRILGAGAVAAAGGLHLQLWATGYSAVSVIGPLFLLDGIASSLVALALLVSRHPLVAVAGAALELGAIAGLALASTTGLFGFHQAGAGVGGDILAAYGTEGFAAVMLAASIGLGWARRPLLPLRRRGGEPSISSGGRSPGLG